MGSSGEGGQGRISEVFLEFCDPLWVELKRHGRDSPEELEKVLHFAWMVWNAVVVDRLRGSEDTLTGIKASTEGIPDMLALIDTLAVRKRSAFAEDLRLIEHYKLVQERGGWRLNVRAREV